MEEHVGIYWHKFLGRLLNKKQSGQASAIDSSSLDSSFLDKSACLKQEQRKLSIILRTMAVNGGLQIKPSFAVNVNVKQNWLQKIAGSKPLYFSAWIDDDTLYLPEKINFFSTKALNQSLYLWLTAMAATNEKHPTHLNLKEQNKKVNFWFYRNQELTQHSLNDFPGLKLNYEQLLTEVMTLRPDLTQLSGEALLQEQAIINAIKKPESISEFPTLNTQFKPLPVALWLIHPRQHMNNDSDDSIPEKAKKEDNDSEREGQKQRKQAERVKMPDGKNGLITVRMENIFSWAEFLKVDRTTDDDEDEKAGKIADDMDHLSIARDQKASASKINFNMDLPAAAYDDTVLSEGILYPEWHYKKQLMLENQVSIIPMMAMDAEPCQLPLQLINPARKVKRIFEALMPSKKWFRGELEGSELDLDAFIQYSSDRMQNTAQAEQGLYRQFKLGHRDLATLLLADLSLSTDTSVNNEHKVIDVIRDSLHLFSEALTQTGDRHAIYGFSSRKKEHVRFNQIKAFDEPLNSMVRGRIQAIKPGYYTRLGAAIRHASHLLEQQVAEKQILLILTDGKPNDLDHYEGRYGIEDTRHAVIEAKSKGLHPFCFTIDKEGSDYLPHLFGPDGYSIIRKPEELPSKLPMMYAELTQA